MLNKVKLRKREMSLERKTGHGQNGPMSGLCNHLRFKQKNEGEELVFLWQKRDKQSQTDCGREPGQTPEVHRPSKGKFWLASAQSQKLVKMGWGCSDLGEAELENQ